MIKKAFFLFSLSVLLPFSAFASTIETAAKQAILIDFDTRTVLMEKNSQEKMPTSSMSKVITAYQVFSAVTNGQIALDDTCKVSEKAWRKGGSKMFVDVNSDVSVEDLLRGVIIQSGNDATIALAECIAGSEEAFADMLNETAKKLGMINSNFTNASGWPDPDHYSTAYDLAILGYHLIQDFPDYYHYYSEREFTYNGIKQSNRNPLLGGSIGADGIKTGHTEVAGYGLLSSAINKGRRLVLVVNGLTSKKDRGQESEKLLRWGFNNFKSIKLFGAEEVIDSAKVWMGKSPTVPIVAGEDLLSIYNPRNKDQFEVSLKLTEPIPAPIAKGQKIGDIVVKTGDFPAKEYPVYAGADVPKSGPITRLITKAKAIFSGQ